MTDTNSEMTRGQFITIAASFVATVFLSKFIGSHKALNTVLDRTAKVSSNYGNSSYGGKKV